MEVFDGAVQLRGGEGWGAGLLFLLGGTVTLRRVVKQYKSGRTRGREVACWVSEQWSEAEGTGSICSSLHNISACAGSCTLYPFSSKVKRRAGD